MSNRTITEACLRFSGIFFICAILVISGLVMCTFPISEGASVSKFVGNKEGYNLTFNTMGIDATPVFSVENKVPLTGASLKISTSDKGDGNYPLIPTVDVGVDNDIEWKYGGNGYGQFGRQTHLQLEVVQPAFEGVAGGDQLAAAVQRTLFELIHLKLG